MPKKFSASPQFKNEVAEWAKQGIISIEQSDKILSLYPDQQDVLSRGEKLLYGIGSSFLGLAVLLLVGMNWEAIPVPVRLWSLILLTLLFSGFGISRFEKSNGKTGHAFLTLGAFLLTGTLALIGQTYHLSGESGGFFLLLAAGYLPLFTISNGIIVGLLYGAAISTWLFLRQPTAVTLLVYPLLAIPALYSLFFKKRNVLLFYLKVVSFFYLIEMAFLLITIPPQELKFPFYYSFQSLQVYLGISILILLSSVGRVLYRSGNSLLASYGGPLRFLVGITLLPLLYALSFDEPWKDIISYCGEHSWGIRKILLAFVFAEVLVLAASKPKDTLLKGSSPVILDLTSSGLFVILSLIITGVNPTPESAFTLAVVFNFIIFGLGIIYIVLGVKEQRTWVTMRGIGLLLVLAVTRYIDLLGDYMGAAILFGVGGLLLIIVAKSLRKTKRIG